MISKTLLSLIAFSSLSLGYSFNEVADAIPLKVDRPEGRFIVELEAGSNFADGLFDSFRQQGLDVSINNNFDSPIFNGVSLEIGNSTTRTLDEIKALPGIKDAWMASYVTLDFQAQDYSSQKWNPHALTGVDKVHQNDQWGDGVNVAVIDSGVDYNHPALAGSLVKGYDFTGNPQLPTNDASDCIGHGTFVSSVIAGHSDTLLGVAPKSSVKMYKVFGCSPTTTDDIILAALLKAYSENPDVISLSLGSDRGYPSIPVSLVSAKIAETIPVVYAAGNSGSSGLYHASSGATGKGVIAVASVEANQLLAWSGVLYSSSGLQMPFQYVSNNGDNFGIDGELGVDYVGDLCQVQYQGGAIDGSSRFMAGYKGSCSAKDILSASNELGYVGVLVFTSQTGLKYSKLDLSSGLTGLWGMSTYDALYWMYNEAVYGNNFWASFSKDDQTSSAVSKADAYSGVINSFTSWGPTFEQGFYPHIAAPGGDVLGAKIGGGYSISSGTSFACPYITGVISLFLAANGRTNPQELRNKVIGSGRLMAQTVSSPGGVVTDRLTFAPLIQQGNGIIDAVSLFETKTKILSNPYLELNDTVHRVNKHTITVMNDGNYDINYSVSTRNIPSVYAKNGKVGNVSPYYPETVANSGLVQLSQNSFTIAAGDKLSFDVIINAPTGLDISKAPIFQGAIDIRGNNGEFVTVPYMGIEVDTSKWTAWADRPLVAAKDSLGSLQNLTLYVHDFAPSKGDSPVIYHNIRFGTKFYSFDLVENGFNLSSYKYSMLEGENGFIGPLMTSPFKGGPIAFPVQFADISSKISYFGISKLSDGTKIPNGTFRILCRSLKPFGAPENYEDWQLYLSDPFTVNESS